MDWCKVWEGTKFYESANKKMLKKIEMNVHYQFNLHILIFSNQNINIIRFIKVIKVKTVS
jgi:hypothetical protein